MFIRSSAIKVAGVLSFAATIATIWQAGPQISALFESKYFIVNLLPPHCSDEDCESEAGSLSLTEPLVIHTGIPYDRLNVNDAKHLCVQIPFTMKLRTPRILNEAKLRFSIQQPKTNFDGISKKSGYPELELNPDACRFSDLLYGQRYNDTELTRSMLLAGDFKSYVYTLRNAAPNHFIMAHLIVNATPQTFIVGKTSNKPPYDRAGNLESFTDSDSLLMFSAPIRISVSQIIADTETQIGAAHLYIHYVKVASDVFTQSLIVERGDEEKGAAEKYWTNPPPVRTIFARSPTFLVSKEVVPGMIEWVKGLETKHRFDGKFIEQSDATLVARQTLPFYEAKLSHDLETVDAPGTALRLAERLNIRFPERKKNKTYLDEKDHFEFRMTEYNELRNKIRENYLIQMQFMEAPVFQIRRSTEKPQ